MQAKRAILHLLFLITMTMDFSQSAQLSSVTGNDAHVDGSSGSSLNNRLQRRSAFFGRGPSDSVRENAGDEGDRERDAEDTDVDKRASSFVRIGRYPTMSRFVRIGRSSVNDLNDNVEYDHDAAESQYVSSEGYPSSLDLSGGLEGVDDVDKRASSFVRIGKSSNPFSDEPEGLTENMKRASHFERFGRAPSNFVRIGKSPSSFVRIGKAPSSFVRIGKSPSSFVRIGKSSPNFVRIGRGPSSFVRIGKSYFDDAEKRARGFVRIGKDSDLHTAEFPDNYNQQSSGFASSWKADDNRMDLLKRASSFVRIGKSADEDKRTSSFVRIGKSDQDVDDEQKRTSSFVRIGKAGLSQDTAEALEKKGSSFVRIGKSLHYGSFVLPPSANQLLSMKHPDSGNAVDEEQPIRLVNRGSAFVRIGKIPSSAFVRIGKNKDLIIDPTEYSRGQRGGQSSFVRIG